MARLGGACFLATLGWLSLQAAASPCSSKGECAAGDRGSHRSSESLLVQLRRITHRVATPLTAGSSITLKVYRTGKRITAQPDGDVHALWENQDSWETLVVEKVGGQNGDEIKSGDVMFLRSSVGNRLTAKKNGVVHNKWDHTGEWERFTIVKPGGGLVSDGDLVFLRTWTGSYLDADGEDQPGEVSARFAEMGEWQKLIVEVRSSYSPPTNPPTTATTTSTTASTTTQPPTDPPSTTHPPTDPPTTMASTTQPPTDPPTTTTPTTSTMASTTTLPPTDPPTTSTTTASTMQPPTEPPTTTASRTHPPTDPPTTSTTASTTTTTQPPTDPPTTSTTTTSTTTQPPAEPPTTTTASTTQPPTDPPTTTTPTTSTMASTTTLPPTDPPTTTTAPPTTTTPQTTTTGQSHATVDVSLEWFHFQLVNELRAAGFTCPGGRVFVPNPIPLKFNCRLWRAAVLHSKDMADNNYFSHYSLDGRSPWDRAEEQGTKANAENIAAGSPSPEATLGQWKNSDGHCRNMMNPVLKAFAIGHAAGGTNRHTWTQMFAMSDLIDDTTCYPDPSLVQVQRHRAQPDAEVGSAAVMLGEPWSV